MLVFAHVGLILAAANGVWKKIGLQPELVFVTIGSMLPDIIDKFLSYLIYGSMATGRIFAHTLLFFLVLTTIAVIFQSPKVASIAGGVLDHLVLDSVRRTPMILLWPLLGYFPIDPELRALSILGYFEMLMKSLVSPYILIHEVIGFLCLLHIGITDLV